MLGHDRDDLPTCPRGRDVAHFAHVCWDCPMSQPMRELAGVCPPPAGDHLARGVGWPSIAGQRAWTKKELEDLKLR
eukprot:15437898-Alexandrium_andersonii.AAC.1